MSLLSSRPAAPPRDLPEIWTHRTAERAWRGPLGEANARPTRGRTSPLSDGPHWIYVLIVLTRHEFRARYRAQALGVVWSLLNPLVMMGLLSLIFTRVLHSEIPDFPIFLLIGLVVWQWIATTTNAATQAFVANAELIKHTVFPRQLLPMSLVLSLTVNFAMEAMLLPLFIPIFPSGFRLTPALLLIPVFIMCLGALLVGICLFVSVLNVLYRDLAYLVNTGLLLLYWMTPVIYPLSIVPEPYQLILKCNPIGGILTALRNAIMLGEVPSALGWAGMVVPTLLVLAVGWHIFRRYERMVLDYV